MQVIKRDGTVVPFDRSKIRRWVQWAVRDQVDQVDMEYHIVSELLKKLPYEVTTEEIHQTMLAVCLNKEEMAYSRVASELEMASILKNQESYLGILRPESITFTEFLEYMEDEGLYSGDWLEDSDLIDCESEINECLIGLEAQTLEFWTVKQWVDKYSLSISQEAVETPAQGCLAIAISLHGVTETAFDLARDLIAARINLPTPVLNGCRNGNFNSISCCLMESSDSVESIEVAEHIASSMTAKKAGIGVMLDTRSNGDPVKNGAVKHLGKQPLYKAIEAGVKKFTQITRGGSATMSYKCIDPDIMEMLLYKTQRMDLARRVDKIDYNFTYNEAFIKAVLHGEDWYLFSKYWAPEVHDAIHLGWEDYEAVVKDALKRKVHHTKVKAIDVLQCFGGSRWEVGRVYCQNLTESNKHTPFPAGSIHQSNLCLEIALPTTGYIDMKDLYSDNSVGETAFCSIAALNVANITDEEYEKTTLTVVRTVNRMIDLAPMMTTSMKNSIRHRRSLGIGITGLASKVYKAGLDYDGSKESIDFVEETAELHYFFLLKASQKLAKETGISVTGIDPNWLPIDTMQSTKKPTQDWESIRGLPRYNSVLAAHMPTESSAVFSNATNGVYPSRVRVIYKQARRGKIQFISEYFTPDKLTAWEVNMIPYYAAIQGYTDQAISADYFTDFTVLSNKKIKMESIVEWFIRQAVAGVKTAYYENFLDSKGEEVEQEESCEGGGCKL